LSGVGARALLLATLFGAIGCSRGGAHDAQRTVRIGYQKYGIVLLLKADGRFEAAERRQGTRVEWVEFPSGPPMMEAFAAGRIDFGIAGEVPPVLAQAAGASVVYVGAEPPSPTGEAIVVRAESPVRTVVDLRGRTIALNKGSNVHYFLVRALEAAGLRYTDVTLAFLAPGDARVAFDAGRVDAWVIWDPFLASVELRGGVRIIRDATGLALNPQYYLASRAFAREQPDIVRALLAEISRIDAEVTRDPGAAAAFLGERVGLERAALDKAMRRGHFAVAPLDAAMIRNQQAIADTFLRLGLISDRISIDEAIWR